MIPELEWTDLDRKAVDTARVLAMDAVQKVGNGHPGTAMSLAPAAYLLFQKVMRHDPADPDWISRDRFVLSAGHSSITLYTQLYLGGFGLELDDLKSLRTWGSKTPGHPEFGHTAGVEVTTGPLGQGVGNAVGMAMAARRERGLLDPGAAPGESVFDHHIYAIASDGDLQEGVSSEASSIAGTQELGNLTVIYDRNRISIEGDTDIAFTEDVAMRYEAYGWHVQTVDWTKAGDHANGTDYHEDVPALYDAIKAADAVTDKPSLIVLRTIIAWPAPNAQNTGAAHGSALGEEEVAATKEVLGFDPEQTFEVPDDVLEHTRSLLERGKAWGAEWDRLHDTWAAAAPRAGGAAAPAQGARASGRPRGGAPDVRRRCQGRGHARRVRPGDQRHRTGHAGAVGRVGRSRRLQQHLDQGRPLVPPGRPVRRGVEGRPARRSRPALRHPRARHGRDHERHRCPRRHPGLRRHVPDVLRLHARLGPRRLTDAGAGRLRLDPRLESVSARTVPPTSRSSTSGRSGASPGSTSCARPTPTRPLPRGCRS